MIVVDGVIHFYDIFTELGMKKQFDWENDEIKIMLVRGYSFNSDHQTKTEIDDLNVEVSGPGYEPGGLVIPNRTVTLYLDLNLTEICADSVVWPHISVSTDGAITYDASTGFLLFYIAFDQLVNVEDSDFAIQWDLNGIFCVKQSE